MTRVELDRGHSCRASTPGRSVGQTDRRHVRLQAELCALRQQGSRLTDVVLDKMVDGIAAERCKAALEKCDKAIARQGHNPTIPIPDHCRLISRRGRSAETGTCETIFGYCWARSNARELASCSDASPRTIVLLTRHKLLKPMMFVATVRNVPVEKGVPAWPDRRPSDGGPRANHHMSGLRTT